MRKLISLSILVLSALLVLAGCQPGPSAADNPTANTPVPKVETNPTGGPEKGGGQQAPGVKAD